MNNISKLALLVAAGVSSQAFAAQQGQFDVGVYGKIGATTQIDGDKAGHASLNPNGDEGNDFSMYQDTKAGVTLGYNVTNNVKVFGEAKADFQGHDAELRLEQLNVQAKYGMFDATAGRMRTPLYMNSVDQDDDFAMATFRTVRGFSTDKTALETFDGAKFGITHEMSFGKFNANAMAGVAKDRDYKFYDGKDSIEYTVEADDFWGLDANLATQFGKFRVAHFEAKVGEEHAPLSDFESTSLGYAYNTGSLFVNAELARETEEDMDTDKGYATVGYKIQNFVPSVTYSQVTTDFNVSGVKDAENKTWELGLAYDLNKNIRLKTSYELVNTDSFDDDVFNLGVAFKL